MAAAKPIIAIIDRAVAVAMNDLRMVLAAIEGSFARAYRQEPSMRGLQRFIDDVRGLPEAASRFVRASLSHAEGELLQYRTAVDPDAPESAQLASLAADQVRSMVETLVAQEARKFRLHAASRSSVAATNMDLRLLNRAGQHFRAEEMLFLVVRKAMLDAFNEAQIAGMTARGAIAAQVYHVKPEHRDHGQLIVLDPLSLEKMGQIFHPRASAVIGLVS